MFFVANILVAVFYRAFNDPFRVLRFSYIGKWRWLFFITLSILKAMVAVDL
jgi:hypothetical protein